MGAVAFGLPRPSGNKVVAQENEIHGRVQCSRHALIQIHVQVVGVLPKTDHGSARFRRALLLSVARLLGQIRRVIFP